MMFWVKSPNAVKYHFLKIKSMTVHKLVSQQLINIPYTISVSLFRGIWGAATCYLS